MNTAMSAFVNLYDDVRCALRIAGVDESVLTVASFTGNEGLSRLFEYAIVVTTEQEDVDELEQALGREAAFVVSRGGSTELVVHGIVTEVSPDGVFVGKDRARSTIVVEPTLANLRHTGGFRIFQEKTVEEIVRELAAPERVETTWHVYPPLAKREYTVQADESDLQFLSRLAADEGLHYYFEHTAEATTLVFTNRADGFRDLEGDADIDFHDPGGAVSGEHVQSIHRAQRVRTGTVEHRDYDFRAPATLLVSRAALSGAADDANAKRRELRAYPGGFRDTHDLGERRAFLRLEQERSDAFTLRGTASTLRFLPGKTFTLSGHRDRAFNRKLLLTEVTVGATVHGAISPAANGNGGAASEMLTTFQAVPAKTPIRPLRLSKPRARLESARVVGPTDGDPFVDEFGRVKVQFHWDRDGKNDAHSSCWIRMMTPVANFDEGFWQAHKVGAEVLVGFIDDDIDRPVVIGAVYNGVETQPYKMPGQVAKSTWKTKSVPGCGGFNEITQDNSAGQEAIYVHAQKNLNVDVLDAHTESVGSNQTSTVGANRTGTIGANQTTTVGANDTTTVAANQTHSAGVDQSFSAGANQSLSSGVDQSLSAGANQSITVGAAQTITVSANRSLTVSGTDTVTVSGNHALTSSANVNVKGSNVTIEADGTLTLKCGGTSITLTSSSITIQGPSNVSATSGDSSVTLVPGTATFASSGASLKATGGSAIFEVGGDFTVNAGGNADVVAGGHAKVIGELVSHE